MRLPLAAYEEIRQDSRLFFVVPGHEVPEAEDVVRKGDGYFVVRKHVDVADITEQGDPREPAELGACASSRDRALHRHALELDAVGRADHHPARSRRSRRRGTAARRAASP